MFKIGRLCLNAHTHTQVYICACRCIHTYMHAHIKSHNSSLNIYAIVLFI